MFHLLLLSTTSLILANALHENDNYCDNGQNAFWCNADCSGFYYCAGGERGLDQACPSAFANRYELVYWCANHEPMIDYAELTGIKPLVGSTSTGWQDACPDLLPIRTGQACWSARAAPDKCESVTCSGHGTCTSSSGKCTCSEGYAGADCATRTTGDALCPGKLELMIVLDMSGSVSRSTVVNAVSDFTKEKQFGTGMLSPFKVATGFTRVGVVWFESKAYLRQPLTFDGTAIATAIFREQGNGGTRIDLALQEAEEELVANGRKGVPQLVVLVTDGSGGSPGDAATKMKASGIHVTTVGFGNVDREELLGLASYRGGSDAKQVADLQAIVTPGSPTYGNYAEREAATKALEALKDYYEAPEAKDLDKIFKDMASEACAIVKPIEMCYSIVGKKAANLLPTTLVRPIKNLPPGHPVLTRADCGGPPPGSTSIPSSGLGNDGACTVVSGAEQFYNYGTAANPKGSHSTLEVDGQLRFYALLDKSGQAYFVASIGKAAVDNAYTMMDVQLYNATGSVGIAVKDDSPGNDDLGKDQYSWDPVKKTGTFLWQWPKTSTDGVVIGPMDSAGWCLDLRVYESKPGASTGNRFTDATADGEKKADSQGVVIPDTVLRGQGIRLCAYTCDQDWKSNDGINVPVVSLSPTPAPSGGGGGGTAPPPARLQGHGWLRRRV